MECLCMDNDAPRAARTRSLKLPSTVQIVDALGVVFSRHYLTLHHDTVHITLLPYYITINYITLDYTSSPAKLLAVPTRQQPAVINL